MSKPDGGSAFPEVFGDFNDARSTLTDIYSAGGMSLRAYIATKAMQGLLSTDQGLLWLKGMPGGNDGSCRAAAMLACLHADALIAELSK